MIGRGTGVRVYLACGVTDMRNYVERMIMRSPRRQGAAGRGLEGIFTPHNWTSGQPP